MGQGSKMSEAQWGTAFVLLGSVIWGLYPIFARALVVRLDPIVTAGISSLVAGVPFVLLLAIRGQASAMWTPAARAKLLWIAFTASVLANVLFYTGAARTTGINAALLSQIEPVYSLILSVAVLREVVSRWQLGATLLMLCGAIAVVYREGFEPQYGDLLVLLAPLGYQVGHLLAKQVFSLLPSPMVVPAVRLTVGGIALLGIGIARDPLALTRFSRGDLLSVMGFGLCFFGLEKALWYAAISRIPLSRATALLIPSAAVGVVGGWIVLSEVPTAGQWLGMLLMLMGLVMLAQLGKRSSESVRGEGEASSA